MLDLSALDEATKRMTGTGTRVLSPYLLGDDERSHVAELLRWLNPPQGARILDAGSGTGGVARLMHEARPDLDFTLLNISTYQHSFAPDWMRKTVAGFERTEEPGRHYDMVLFSQSIEHAEDLGAVLREAARVTRMGGTVAIFGLCCAGGDMQRMRSMVSSHARDVDEVIEAARLAGLTVESHGAADGARPFTNELLTPELHASVFDGVAPYFWRFTNTGCVVDLAGHERIALQLSGGRDSMAALWVMRPYWDRLTVYHMDTGDQYPETVEIIDWVRRHVPVQVIKSDVPKYHAEVGWPSDVVPVNSLPFGRAVSGEAVKVVGRYECCFQNLSRPMHERMLADGVTLIVRGQRDEEYAQPPMRSGDTDGRVSLLYPVQGWSAQEVTDYCRRNGLPMAAWYEHGAAHGSDCMRCTAWWDDGRLPYLRAKHPAVYGEVMNRLDQVGEAIQRQLLPLYEGMKDE